MGNPKIFIRKYLEKIKYSVLFLNHKVIKNKDTMLSKSITLEEKLCKLVTFGINTKSYMDLLKLLNFENEV